MDKLELKKIVEALLISTQEPLSIEKLLKLLLPEMSVSASILHEVMTELTKDYQSHAFELIKVAGGYQIQTKLKYSEWINRCQMDKPAKYSRALLETLAIIAYKQPVTRADIEAIRGVAVNTPLIKTLLEREWIRIAGHKDVPGKPAVFVTTNQFLHYFNLQSLHQLPTLAPIQDALAEAEI